MNFHYHYHYWQSCKHRTLYLVVVSHSVPSTIWFNATQVVSKLPISLSTGRNLSQFNTFIIIVCLIWLDIIISEWSWLYSLYPLKVPSEICQFYATLMKWVQTFILSDIIIVQLAFTRCDWFSKRNRKQFSVSVREIKIDNIAVLSSLWSTWFHLDRESAAPLCANHEVSELSRRRISSWNISL